MIVMKPICSDSMSNSRLSLNAAHKASVVYAMLATVLVCLFFPFLYIASSHSTCSDPWCHGNGHYGQWGLDEYGGVVYDYSVDQLHDPMAFAPSDPRYRYPTDQNFQLGNDRLVAYASNYGYVTVRQDEGGPKWLHDNDLQWQWGAGYGHLLNASDSTPLLSSFYTNDTSSRSGSGAVWHRRYGLGYMRKSLSRGCLAINHTVLTPDGDEPVFISQVVIRNLCSEPLASLAWVDVASGALRLQDHFSSVATGISTFDDPRAFARAHYASRFTVNGSILTQHRRFVPLSAQEWTVFNYTQAVLLNESLQQAWTGPMPELWPGSKASLWDEHPPTVHMADISPQQQPGVSDGVDWGTDCSAFYSTGGIERPAGRLSFVSEPASEAACSLASKSISELAAGGSVTLAFLWMYSTDSMQGRFSVHDLARKYRPLVHGDRAVRSTVQHYLRNSVRLRIGRPMSSWQERESVWHSYMTLSSLTYDDYFNESILDQGTLYRYVSGFQGATRDPLQHVLPLLMLPAYAPLAAGVVRYSLKETHPPGVNELGPPFYSLPYGLMSHGMVSPWALRPSDLELWLLWTTAEYVLTTRDTSLFQQQVRFYTQEDSGPDHSVADALSYTLQYSLHNISVGQHGIFRSLTSDWSDTLCLSFVPGCQHTGQLGNEAWQRFASKGESVMNAAIATVVLPRFADALELVNASRWAADIRLARDFAAGQAAAMRASAFNRNGTWLRRAFFGDDKLGWLGEDEFYMTQNAYALLGGLTFTEPEARNVSETIDALVMQPSPIGAIALWPESDKPYQPCGNGENGGIWPALNQPLVWALSTVNISKAWLEWQRNSLATASEVYPGIWASIWSSSDAVNSRCAGADAGKPQYYPVWPTQCTHKHAWPLVSASKLAGVHFTVDGLRLSPAPLPAAALDATAKTATAITPSSSWAFLSPRVSLEHCGDECEQRGSLLWSGHYQGRLDRRWRLQAQLPVDAMRLSAACRQQLGLCPTLRVYYHLSLGEECNDGSQQAAIASGNAAVELLQPSPQEVRRWSLGAASNSHLLLHFSVQRFKTLDGTRLSAEDDRWRLCWAVRETESET